MRKTMNIDELAALLLGVKDKYENDELNYDDIEQWIFDRYEMSLKQLETLASDLVLLTNPFLRNGQKHYCFGVLHRDGVFEAVSKITKNDTDL